MQFNIYIPLLQTIIKIKVTHTIYRVQEQHMFKNNFLKTKDCPFYAMQFQILIKIRFQYQNYQINVNFPPTKRPNWPFPHIGRKYEIKNKVAIALECKLDVKSISCLVLYNVQLSQLCVHLREIQKDVRITEQPQYPTGISPMGPTTFSLLNFLKMSKMDNPSLLMFPDTLQVLLHIFF